MKNTAAVAQRWLNAFNAHNLEALLALYHEDAVHFSPKLKVHQPATGGLIQGKTALRNWWADALNRLPTLHYKLTQLTADNDRVFMEYTRQVVGEPDMTVAEILEIKDGLIVASKVYHGTTNESNDHPTESKEPSRH